MIEFLQCAMYAGNGIRILELEKQAVPFLGALPFRPWAACLQSLPSGQVGLNLMVMGGFQAF